MKVSLSRLHYPVRSLGPGKRVGVWFQGCSIRCAGCISADTWATAQGLTTVDEVMATIARWLADADGVTLTGGEPFDQSEALMALLLRLRAATPRAVLLFSGYSYEVLESRLNGSFAGLIDAVITDPYEAATAQTLALRGSDNQRLHCLTGLGEAVFRPFDRALTNTDRQLDVFMQADGTVWMAGIPRRGDLQRLTDQLATEGHFAATTDAATGIEKPRND